MSCASVVQIVQLSTGPSGDFQVSHSPANAICSPDLRLMKCGCLSDLAPFVEPVGHDEAPTLLEGRTEGGLGIDRLDASINARGTDLGILRPAWNQSPLCLEEFPLIAVAHAHDVLRRGDVVGRQPLIIERSGDRQNFGKEPGIGEEIESAAHALRLLFSLFVARGAGFFSISNHVIEQFYQLFFVSVE